MAASSLQHRFIEPALCHSLPLKPTCLAYDSVHNLLAIGCDNGKVIILSSGQREVKEHYVGENKCVQLLSFNSMQGKKKDEHQSYLSITLTGHKSVFLWTVNGISLEQEQIGYYKLKEIPSVLEWSPMSSEKCYIGTEAGNVYVVIIEAKEPNIIHEDISKHIGHKNHGKVVKVLQKSKQQLIVIYSNGICILWDKESKIRNRAEITDEMPIAAWFHSQDSMIVGCSNGQLFDFDCKAKDSLFKKDDHRSFRVSESGTNAPILKLQRRHQDRAEWLAFCESNTLYIHVQKDGRNLKPSQEIYNTVNKVVDITFMTQDAGTAELAVLTETELLLYAKETRSSIYQDVSQSHKYPYIVSPVTCLQHCGLCTKEFLEANSSTRPKVRNTPVELIATGHDDGSFRLWECFYEKQVLSFEIARLVYTAQYFNQLEKPIQAITLIKMDHKQGNLLIVNKCNRVLVFSCKKQGKATQAVSKPQSHEIILKDYEDKTPSTKALETPFPHFSPPSPNPPLQLLQHFSCYYHKAQNNEKMDTVSVNCVEYNEEMGMLAVGTGRGLVVVDTHMNMLIQVIASENKLIKICTKDTNTKIGDKNSCDVKCLETANMILDKDPARQLTLWVGTKSGVIACLVIARGGEEPLQLRNTGIFRGDVEGGSINGFQFYEVSACEEERSIIHTNVLVSTKDYITVIKCPEISSSKDSIRKMTGGVIKSGLFKFKDSPIKDPTHFVSLTKTGTQFLVHELQDQGLGKEELSPISGTSVALFSSSGGSHCVIKCADNRGPQLMYFEDKNRT